MVPRWYAARTKSRQETVALRNLARQQFEAYSPHVEITRTVRRRIITTSEPVFPGYVLIRFALADAAWRAINSTRGIVSLIMTSENGIPAPLPVGEVEAIQRREKSGDLVIPDAALIRRGDKVRIKFGTAADAIGKVIFTRGERIELLLHLLGRETRVKAPLHAVEKI